jgi:hypothetical protein
MIAQGSKPKSSLGQIFKSKLGCFVKWKINSSFFQMNFLLASPGETLSLSLGRLQQMAQIC